MSFLILTAYTLHVAAQTPADGPQPSGQPVPGASAPAIPTAAPPEGKTQSGPGQPLEDKRVFGVLPNYRTAESSVPFVPITAKQKFTIATKDSFDYPVLLTTAFFAGLSQLEGTQNNVYGQGVKGFAHRYGISYIDQVVGNYFPEAIVPALFHEDPRYFRKGTGSIGGRTFYALSRIVVCKTDSGNTAFNANEFVGNGLAAMVTMAYHPHERTWGDGLSQMTSYIATDAAGQVMKEFWPDVKRKFFTRHQKAD
jgi:hypothetical protein